MFAKDRTDGPSKDPPRGKRGRMQERRSKYDLSSTSSCVRPRAAPEEKDEIPPEESEVPLEPKREETHLVATGRPHKKVILKSCGNDKNQLCCANRCASDKEHDHQCSCGRRLNDTVVVPHGRRTKTSEGHALATITPGRDDRNGEQKYIRLEPSRVRQTPCSSTNDESDPTLPHPPPRFFRPNAIPQLQRYYWDIGDTTDLEFKFQENCRTVSCPDTRGFKVWRYWCQTFSMDCTIGDLVIFIGQNIEVPFAEYRLLSYCRGRKDEILPTDWYKTLRCLLLYPKATIVILPRLPNYAALRLWLSRLLIILCLPLLFLMVVIRCAIAYLIHAWNYCQHHNR